MGLAMMIRIKIEVLTMIEVLVGWVEEPMFEHWLSEWGWLINGHDIA